MKYSNRIFIWVFNQLGVYKRQGLYEVYKVLLEAKEPKKQTVQ